MAVHRPGDVLAGRYRLADLLSESDRGRFWLAHDSILGRPVAVHVMEADDPRAAALMKAARTSAALVDQRLLRVLDAETRDGISYVVSEWGRGTSLDILLTRSGPLPPRRAAWITSEVAATLAKAHDLGHTHGRLNPENILIDEAGSVRIIGFAVEAALYGLPAGSATDDDIDLAAVLAACLTATWSGSTPSSLADTPTSGDHPMRPRQVRAGVPRLLDDLCEAALNPASRGRHAAPVLDARYLYDQLTAYLGDPSDVAGLPAEQSRPAPGTVVTSLTLPPAGASATSSESASGDGGVDDFAALDELGGPEEPDDDLTGPPTEAALPSFDEDDSWHRPRDTPAPPPPAFEAPTPKPLFADEMPGVQAPEPVAGRAPQIIPPDTQVGAAPATAPLPADTTVPATPGLRPDAPSAGEPATPAEGTAYSSASEQAPRRGRRWLPLAIGLLVLAVVVVAVLTVHGGGGGGSTPSATPSAAPAKPITGLSATDFDPQANPPSEFPEDAKYAVDGKDTTSWHTSTYTDQLGSKPPSLKSGVGLVVDLRRQYAVDSVHLTFGAGPTGLSLYLTDQRPTDVEGLKPAATTTIDDQSGNVALHHAHGRYLVVWLTSLPRVSGGYRGEVAEIAVTGTAR